MDTGGQAFPKSDGGWSGFGASKGMTLRDYFAGQFLTSFRISGGQMDEQEVSEKCYRLADAMIQQRNKNG